MRRMTYSLMLLVLALSATAVAGTTPVNGYELKTFLNGKTAKCIKTSDNSTCDTYFADDGSIKRYTPSDGKTRQGKWWVDADGMLNVQWTGKKKPLKFSVVDTGEGHWQLLRRGKIKSLITGAQPGDHIN